MSKNRVPDEQRIAYSVMELAERVGVSHQHIRNRIAVGKIPLMDKEIWGERDLIPAPWVHAQVEKVLKNQGGM